jgi:hypothetical protein
LFRKKWKEEKGYCSKFDRRPVYKQALNQFHQKIERSISLTSKKGLSTHKIRPRTSIPRHNTSAKLHSSKISHFISKKPPSTFLDIKTKELQRPILKEDYENIYAVSTTNLYENFIEENLYEEQTLQHNEDVTKQIISSSPQ